MKLARVYMKRYPIVTILFLVFASIAQAAENYTINPTKTTPNFEVKNLGFATLTGHFNKTSGNVMLDFKAKTGSVDLIIFTDSLGMGWWQAWAEHLLDPELFNVKNFPTMSYKSDKLIFSGDKVVGSEGQFTMLGVTKPIILVVNNFQCVKSTGKSTCSGQVTSVIKRSDFGLSKYMPMVSDEVKISVPVEVSHE